MAAQRLGSILTNVTGTSKQLLRVNEAETGFEFVSPASLPTYTVTNDTTDRVIDANDVTVDKVADVVSTLIKDMATIYNGGPAAFTWSTSEQVWPFEKSANGDTLYCRQVTVATLPNFGTVTTTVTGVTPTRIFRMSAFKRRKVSVYDTYMIPEGTAVQQVGISADNTLIIYSLPDSTGWEGIVKLIYWKA
jgi:hypothetical protein